MPKDELSLRKKARYFELLPLSQETSIINQFGWLPVSVIRPERDNNLDAMVGDDGDTMGSRRPGNKVFKHLRYSKFHSELAELVVKYWSTEGALVVDPFAGRSTRGVMTLRLGRRYEGYEIAPKTFAMTNKKVSALGGRVFCSDGCLLSKHKDSAADLIFTCPPYHNLEKYQSTKGQLSDEPSYESFLAKIKLCAKNVVRVMRKGAFCCWVCADWCSSGFRLFHSDSLTIFQNAGLTAWDIVIIHNNSPYSFVTAVQNASKRYTSKVHEYLLVFRKE